MPPDGESAWTPLSIASRLLLVTYREPDADLIAEQAAKQKQLDAELTRFAAAVRKSPQRGPARLWRDLATPAGRAQRWHELLHLSGCVMVPLLTLPWMLAGWYVAGLLYDSPGDFAGALGGLVYGAAGVFIGFMIGLSFYALLRNLRRSSQQG